jgi:hypothetical protein
MALSRAALDRTLRQKKANPMRRIRPKASAPVSETIIGSTSLKYTATPARPMHMPVKIAMK